MTVIELELLTGRYHATPWGKNVNEGIAEWPPSPWRFLRALISSWKRTCAHLSTDDVRPVLEKLSSPPSFHLPPATQSGTRHYMPVRQSGKTTMVFDTFVSVDRTNSVYLIWDVELTYAQQSILAQILNGVTYLGRAESWTDMRMVDTIPEEINCWPVTDYEHEYESVRVLTAVPDGDLIESLCVQTADIRKEKRSQPDGAMWVEYLRRRDAFTPTTKSVSVRQTTTPTMVKFALSRKPLPSITDTLTVGRLVRRAIMALSGRSNDGFIFPVLSGKDENGQPLTGHGHAHYLPMDTTGDGRIDSLVVFARDGFGEGELEAICKLTQINPGEGGMINLVLLGTGTGVERSKKWRSVTPFLLGRHPKVDRSGKPKCRHGRQIDGPVDQVYREWDIRRASDPKLPELVNVEMVPKLEMQGRNMLWHKFRWYRTGRKKRAPGIVCGFELEFSDSVIGPVALGRDCHFGLGQFKPIKERL